MACCSLRFVFGLDNYVQKLYQSWLNGSLRDDDKIAKNWDKVESFADKRLIGVVRRGGFFIT
ncbi:MAG: hypothetical protein A3F11_05800 [Gammaproteobacteria bacterium RIFCSPHIGHO2_12_FULL_37_14]|nr:MAG: hypothetical protein A3F11_05800 [Gammaproteobacteria bacterium RIFCSPHIGHO2_12_FULL_37_14]